MLSETQKETRIQKLIETEWELFQHVHNEGGRAACQDDWNTFRIMRHQSICHVAGRRFFPAIRQISILPSPGAQPDYREIRPHDGKHDPENTAGGTFSPRSYQPGRGDHRRDPLSSHGVAGRIRRTLSSTFYQGPPPSLQRGHEMGHLRRNLSPGRASDLLCRNTAALSRNT